MKHPSIIAAHQVGRALIITKMVDVNCTLVILPSAKSYASTWPTFLHRLVSTLLLAASTTRQLYAAGDSHIVAIPLTIQNLCSIRFAANNGVVFWFSVSKLLT